MVERAGLENRYALRGIAGSNPALTVDEGGLSNKSDQHNTSATDSLAPPLRKDSELNEIVEAWPSLSQAVKVGIMAMVKAARTDENYSQLG